MTITDVLKKYDIEHTVIAKTNQTIFLRLKSKTVLFWINEGNAFKMKRKWFELLQKEEKKYALVLCDKVNKKYYYLKFNEENNWLQNSFDNCDKDELFLGKQVLNELTTLNRIMMDIKKGM